MNDFAKLSNGDGRFARFELMAWWDQQRLARAKILLIGAGALGNEILKNLALLGVGRQLNQLLLVSRGVPNFDGDISHGIRAK